METSHHHHHHLLQPTAHDAHVIIFPLPIQAPVNSMLKLAELISIYSGGHIHITFLTTDHIGRRLGIHTANSRFNGYRRFYFRTFSDGLPADHPRGGDKFAEMVDAVESQSRPLLKEMLNSSNSECNYPPVTCLIAHGFFDFALDLGKEARVPVIYFRTFSASSIWMYLSIPNLIEAGDIPSRENDDLDELVNVPGMESFLRRRDLPEFCQANNPSTHIMVPRVLNQVKQFKEAQGVIVNTFEELDAPILSYIRSSISPNKVYVVGPIHLHLKQRIMEIETMQEKPSSYSNSLLREDRKCIEWLDQQAPRSVIYCSFASQIVITKDQLIEFWHGLVNSGTHFLWIKRPGSVLGMDDDDDDHDSWHREIPVDLLKGVKEKGFIVSWAPQEEVLSHPSVGGFLTHAGWNSTLESIVAGVPMICWPHDVDQPVNGRYVSEIWKVGTNMKDKCDRVTIENRVRNLMERSRDELSKNAGQLALLARKSVEKDGTSYCSLQSLVDDIKSFKLALPKEIDPKS